MLRSLDKAGVGCGWCAQAYAASVLPGRWRGGFGKCEGSHCFLPAWVWCGPSASHTSLPRSGWGKFLFGNGVCFRRCSWGAGQGKHRVQAPQQAECVPTEPNVWLQSLSPALPQDHASCLWARKGAHSDVPLLAPSGPCALGCSTSTSQHCGHCDMILLLGYQEDIVMMSWWAANLEGVDSVMSVPSLGCIGQRWAPCCCQAGQGWQQGPAVMQHKIWSPWLEPSFGQRCPCSTDTDPKALRTMAAGICRTRTSEVRDRISGGLACEQAPGWCGSGIPTLSLCKFCF